ncbi:hypothetical protein Nepgr_004679 [Nepenthes gracilis]|uniref:Uncharacterized protein n=1 Tax=Nepenthes gracilis TaxID=150966 RepID=A0AAD3S1V1_NEPGR|nr:hypothetical protein Nepgr_004679 [Nepenthes gracilis]
MERYSAGRHREISILLRIAFSPNSPEIFSPEISSLQRPPSLWRSHPLETSILFGDLSSSPKTLFLQILWRSPSFRRSHPLEISILSKNFITSETFIPSEDLLHLGDFILRRPPSNPEILSFRRFQLFFGDLISPNFLEILFL